jgi:hypothetical protein
MESKMYLSMNDDDKLTTCNQLILVDYICKHLFCSRSNQPIITSPCRMQTIMMINYFNYLTTVDWQCYSSGTLTLAYYQRTSGPIPG